MAKDNRPPKHLRTLKRGDVREGMVFWAYNRLSRNGEGWVAREKYDERYEKVIMNKREWNAANSEERHRKAREDYVENREEINRKHKEYREANREELKRKRDANREEKKRYDREYAKSNPAKIAAASSRRRAMIRKALHPDHDKNIEDTIFELRDRLTAKTGIQFHVDHIIPISRGGWHHHANLKVIPSKLNLEKWAKLDYQLPDCWVI